MNCFLQGICVDGGRQEGEDQPLREQNERREDPPPGGVQQGIQNGADGVSLVPTPFSGENDLLHIVTSIFSGRRCKVAVAVAVSCFVVVVTVAIMLIVLPVTIADKPGFDKKLVYEKTTAAVKNFPVFHVSDVTVYQSPESPEAMHRLKLFLAWTDCDHLPHKRISNHKESLSQPHNRTLYLLKGSEMSFNICAVTNNSRHHDGTYLDFYFVKGLNYIKTNARPPKSHHQYIIDIGYTTDLDNQTKPSSGWNCTNTMITYSVKEDGYYSTVLIPPLLIHTADLLVWHSVNYTYKLIDVHSNLPEFCSDVPSHKKSRACNIEIVGFQHWWIAQHQCLVVEVDDKVNPLESSSFTHVVMEFSHWSRGRNGFWGVGFPLLIVPIAIVVVPLCYWKLRHRCNNCCRENNPRPPINRE